MKTPFTLSHGKTGIVCCQPWGLFQRAGSRVLCSDGKIRSLAYLASTPDTFFSTPAAVHVNGKYVRGYVTHQEQGYIKGVKESDFLVATVFRQFDGQGDILPPWPVASHDGEDIKLNNLVALAHS